MSNTPRPETLTPETDACTYQSGTFVNANILVVHRDFARKLEREKNEAIKERDEARHQIEGLEDWVKVAGNQSYTCTFNILRKICDGCRCHRMPGKPTTQKEAGE